MSSGQLRLTSAAALWREIQIFETFRSVLGKLVRQREGGREADSWSHQEIQFGAGEMAHQITALAALAEDLGSLWSTHTVVCNHITTCTTSSRGSDTPFLLPWALHSNLTGVK